jgi:hypothetical protein
MNKSIKNSYQLIIIFNLITIFLSYFLDLQKYDLIIFLTLIDQLSKIYLKSIKFYQFIRILRYYVKIIV